MNSLRTYGIKTEFDTDSWRVGKPVFVRADKVKFYGIIEKVAAEEIKINSIGKDGKVLCSVITPKSVIAGDIVLKPCYIHDESEEEK